MQASTKLTLFLAAICWLASLCASAAGLGVIFEVPRLSRLARHSAMTLGTVLYIDRYNHDSRTIEYSIDGVLTHGSIGPVDLPIGSMVTVYYSPEEPKNISIEGPALALRHRENVVVFLSLILSTGVTVALLNQRPLREHPAWNSPRATLALMAIGVIAGAMWGIRGGSIHGWEIVASGLVIAGFTIAVVNAFQVPREAGWRGVLKSRPFAAACVLVASGVVIRAVT